MRLKIIACEGLAPKLTELASDVPESPRLVFLSAEDFSDRDVILRAAAPDGAEPERVVVLIGRDNLRGLRVACEHGCLYVVRAHSDASLLLGSNRRYRDAAEDCADEPLFYSDEYQAAGMPEKLNFHSRAHSAFCNLVGPNTPPDSLEHARALAKHAGLPYREYLTDEYILRQALAGNLDPELFTALAPGFEMNFGDLLLI